MKLTGGCMCGSVGYTVETPSELHYLCHCSDCRKHGGGAWHSAIVVDASVFEVTGETEMGTVTAESGRTIARHGCATCHSHLWVTQWPTMGRISLKAGSLDDPSLFRPRYEIWTRSRVAWAPAFPGLIGHEKGFEGELPKWR
ncbi:MAG: GFA family protein [Pseudomonadota bacterium]